MENESIKKRIDYIDVLKFISIFCVVMTHGTTINYDFLENQNLYRYICYSFRPILSICVPLFFLVNGYLLFSKSLNLKKHIKKTIKLTILTVLWGVIMLIVLMPIKKEYLSIEKFIKYLWNFENGWVNTLWFMGALICIYSVFPLLKITFDNNKKCFIYFCVMCYFYNP